MPAPTFPTQSFPTQSFPTLTRDDVFRIETPRLWLRWPHVDDAASMAPWTGLPDVATMTSTIPVGITVAELAVRIGKARRVNTEGRGLVFVLAPKGDGARPIGMVGIEAKAAGGLEIGYHLDPAHWGRGLGPEAVRAVCLYAFELTSAPRIVAGVRPANTRSARLLEKCGFQVTGRGLHDSPLYGVAPITTYALGRSQPSALRAAQRRRAAGPKLEHELVGLV